LLSPGEIVVGGRIGDVPGSPLVAPAEDEPSAPFYLWQLHASGPPDAEHTVLLLPGALCTAAFFEDLMAEQSLSGESIRLVATTIPGFGRTAAPADLSMERYATLVAGMIAVFAGRARSFRRRDLGRFT
jgi:pimeloyl-ACP methyl ester carboxylesterase